MKKIKVPWHEYDQLKNSGMLTPREDIQAKVSKLYTFENSTDFNEYLVAVCFTDAPISFRLSAVRNIYEPDSDVDTRVDLNKTISDTPLVQQPKSLI